MHGGKVTFLNMWQHEHTHCFFFTIRDKLMPLQNTWHFRNDNVLIVFKIFIQSLINKYSNIYVTNSFLLTFPELLYPARNRIDDFKQKYYLWGTNTKILYQSFLEDNIADKIVFKPLLLFHSELDMPYALVILDIPPWTLQHLVDHDQSMAP